LHHLHHFLKFQNDCEAQSASCQNIFNRIKPYLTPTHSADGIFRNMQKVEDFSSFLKPVLPRKTGFKKVVLARMI